MRLLTFIETSFFTKAIKELFDDDEYQQIQKELLNNPEKGDLIQGTGGHLEKSVLVATVARVAVLESCIIILMSMGEFIFLPSIQNQSKTTLPMLKSKYSKP